MFISSFFTFQYSFHIFNKNTILVSKLVLAIAAPPCFIVTLWKQGTLIMKINYIIINNYYHFNPNLYKMSTYFCFDLFLLMIYWWTDAEMTS